MGNVNTLLACPRCFQRSRGPEPALGAHYALRCRGCGATQQFEAYAARGGAAWKRKGPYTLACGCDSTGGCCEEEGRLYAAIEAAHAGQGELTQARAAYHAHFDTGSYYDARTALEAKSGLETRT